MILSMTGFGEAQVEADGHAYHVELRSVNNRYLKASIRVPDEFAFIEARLEQLLRRKLTRGSITLKLFVRDLSAAAAEDVNVAAIQAYVEQFRPVLDSNPKLALDLATLATLPGVCQPHELTEKQRTLCTEVVERVALEALDKLLEMRAVEGKALAADLRKHCAEVRRHIEAIQGRAHLVIGEYRDRLTARIEELIAGSNVQLAQEDLLKEVAIFAERSDVNEELSRMFSHLDQFEAAIGSGEPAGRKLDFIAQEMLREANTVGSKAGDGEIARHVIDIKSAIDRIKEQVQNAV